MSTVPNVTAQQSIKRIGIILGDLGKLDRSILQYLVLQINTLQHTFEFEFLPPNPEDEFLRRLSNRTTVNRNEIKEAAPAFLDRYRVYLEALIIRNELMDKELPRSLVVVSLARFHNNFYSARKRDISVLS